MALFAINLLNINAINDYFGSILKYIKRYF
jgi:hypothetical protein